MNRTLLARCLAPWIAVLAAASCLQGAQTSPNAVRPNVFFILADDLRPDGLHALGNPVVKTPNLDKLIEQGFVFPCAYTQGSNVGAVCLPSRTMIQTGQSYLHARRAAPTWAQTVKAAGYASIRSGKFGNNPNAMDADFDLHLDGKNAQGNADNLIAFIRERAGKQPLFLYMASPEPHDPQFAPPEFYAMYRPADMRLPPNFLPFHPFDNGEMTVRDEKTLPWPRTRESVAGKLARYCASTSYLDAQVGRVLEALKQTQQLDNTLFVIAGDNGLSLGEHGLLGKQNVYEFGGMHVPLVFSGRGIARGRSNAMAYLFDVYPTVCELTGVAVPPGLDGKSLAPVLAGKADKVREYAFTAYGTVQRAIRDERWKLIRYPQINKTQLFDLQADPREMTDLAAKPEHAAKVQELTAALEKAQRQYGDEAPLAVTQAKDAEWSPARLTPQQIEEQKEETAISAGLKERPRPSKAKKKAGQVSTEPASDLQQSFRDPPAAVRPWAYWWWLWANVDEKSITHDLEEMKKKGIAGVLLFDARGYHDTYVPPPPGTTEFMSQRWRQLVKHAATEAHRLGIQMSINLSSCAGALKGPWLVGDDAPKQLVWATVEVQGPQHLVTRLPQLPGAGRHWDVAVMGARHAAQDKAQSPAAEPAAKPATKAAGKKGGKPAPAIQVDKVANLTGHVDKQGQFTWDVPEGRWTILRFAYALMDDRPNDVDILDPAAVERHYERMGKTLLADAGPLAGKTITHFYSVSWEGAIPTWTPGFEDYFQKLRDYDLRPFLPVLAGMNVGEPGVCERFLRDYHKTLGDCFADHFYGKLRTLSNQAGLKWHSESGGPWTRTLATFRVADQLAFLGRNDMPQGEFWYGGRGFNRPIAMAAHIYGRRLAAAEAFTHMTYHWSVCPAGLKPLGDAAFCDGINHLVWHTFTASPPQFGKPGIEYFAGTHLNPNVTWWEQSGAFLTYLGRCQFLLQQGEPVVDVCCYTGDKPYLHWGHGEKWSQKPSLTLGKEHTYDLINSEILLGRVKVDNGCLVLPSGMRYRLLVVDLEDETVIPEVLGKIINLTRAGATVVLGRRPTRAPGLTAYPACDVQVTRMVDELWGAAEKAGRRRCGKGNVFVGRALDEVLDTLQVAPDFVGPCDWVHRQAEGLDIYFVAGKTAQVAECTFRVSGREPELWDPVTGSVRDAIHYRSAADGRTTVPIALPENGSVFVVFRKPAGANRIESVAAPVGALEIQARVADGVKLGLWQNGRYALKTSGRGEVAVEAAGIPDPLALSGSWNVRFAPGRGAPAPQVFPQLIAWNEHADPAIRHFAGKATYRKTFQLNGDQAGRLVRLQLGDVKHVAEVRVNGKNLGVVWTAPWAVDLTGAVRAGENELEIDVTNVWANRLIGDAGLPEDQRLTKTNVPLKAGPRNFKPYQGYSSQDKLFPSGLLGPVRLEFGRSEEVRF